MGRRISNKELDTFITEMKKVCGPEDSVVIYGSQINKQFSKGDIDMVFVFKDRPAKIHKLKQISKKFLSILDAKYYYLDELDPRTFRECDNGVFALEFLANGTTVIGPNYFERLLRQVSPHAYDRSLYEKVFGYILRMRKAMLSMGPGRNRRVHFKKYFRRVLIDLLLLYRAVPFKELDRASYEDIVKYARSSKILSPNSSKLLLEDSRDSLLKYLDVLEEISQLHKRIRRQFVY
ncbi:hypothetical protein KGO06_02560 [Patescibacteria group bacterium]|nr:hypothetical protein [Patescibacteria group bacterium]